MGLPRIFHSAPLATSQMRRPRIEEPATSTLPPRENAKTVTKSATPSGIHRAADVPQFSKSPPRESTP